MFSHGVLEHFSNKDIVDILNEELRVASTVIFSVPSDYYSEADKIYGDERFMNRHQWSQLISQTRGQLIRPFGYYFQNKVYATINILAPSLLIDKAPYLGFVLTSH